MKKTPGDEEAHATRKQIYSISEELGGHADFLVLTRKTSFIFFVANLFKTPIQSQKPGLAKSSREEGNGPSQHHDPEKQPGDPDAS